VQHDGGIRRCLVAGPFGGEFRKRFCKELAIAIQLAAPGETDAGYRRWEIRSASKCMGACAACRSV
jgi:hypothetical protein